MLKEELLLRIPKKVDLGLIIYDSKTEKYVTHNEEMKFPLASITKLITSVFALQMKAPLKYIDTLIRNHDNKSYLKLLEFVSIEEQNSKLQSIGDIRVSRNNKSSSENVGTPKAIFSFLQQLINGDLLSNSETQLILKSLSLQSDPDGFRFGGNWMHMTGGLEGVCNDVGYLQLNDRIITVVGLVKTMEKTIDWYQLELLLFETGQLIKQYYLESK